MKRKNSSFALFEAIPINVCSYIILVANSTVTLYIKSFPYFGYTYLVYIIKAFM